MPRIFKFSKFALKLFVPHASELTDMKIYIYTDNFDIAYVVTSGFKINVNEVGIVIPQNAVNNMSDGIINYRIEGYLNGEFYMEQRQSNYFLKTPSFEIEDETIIAISTEFVDEGNYKMIIKASEYNVDGLSQIEIDATTFAEEKYEEGKQEQKDKLESITITKNGSYTREDGYNEIHVEVPDLNGDYQTGYDAGYVDGEYRGFNNGYTAGETDQKDKLESISITENGTYTREDGYNEVIVNVEQEGGSCNLQESKYEWRDNTEEFFNILPDEGYDGMSQVDVDIHIPLETKYNEGIEQGKTEGKEDVINSLQTLNVTENGTYTPLPTPFLRLDGDDKYELFFPSENNAFEIKFRANGEGFIEFFNQEGNNEHFIGLKAFIDTSVLYIRWFNKQIYISDVDFSKWHTLVVKMGDENAMVIFDKQIYNDYHKFGSYEDNGNAVNIFGNINLSLDLEHFTLWNTWEEYNNGDTPYFDFKVSSEGLMKNQQGGEYSVVNNIGGGSAQCMEEQMTEGWNKIVVNVEGYEDGYEQGKADQKALMTTATFTRNGAYTREDGYNEVVVNVPSTLYPKFFGVLSDTIGINYHNIYDYMGSDGEIWAGQLWGYVEQNQDKTSNGMMYEFDYIDDIDRAPIANIYMGDNYNLDVLNLSSTKDYNFNSWGLPVWGKKSLVTPWVYNVNNSPTTTKILPDCILGGFECGEVEYINRVFEGAEKLRVFQWLHNLGKSFTSVNTLDLSVLTKLNDDIYGLDSFIEIANSVYDFAVDGMNVNGISYSNVKLPANAKQEQVEAWTNVGWVVGF